MKLGNLASLWKGVAQAPARVKIKAFNPNNAPLIKSNNIPIKKAKISPLNEPLEKEKIIDNNNKKSG